jgi:hypothetical protein
MTPADFKGVTLDDLVVLEQVFSLNVYVYDLQEAEAGVIAARLVRIGQHSNTVCAVWYTPPGYL